MLGVQLSPFAGGLLLALSSAGAQDAVSPRPGPASEALERACSWLAAHQDADGSWDADGFMKHDPEAERCSGPGQPEHDVGVSALALLALLGAGHGIDGGEHGEKVTRGIAWLTGQQDPESGRIGPKAGHAYLYRHGIATLALCEAYGASKSPLLRGAAQRAVDYVLRARNPYSAWRYDSPPVGESDTSVTGWMVAALATARKAGLEVDPDALRGALAWIDEVTDPSTGRVGYVAAGSFSARVPGLNDAYPTDRTGALTASGLLTRMLAGDRATGEGKLRKHADLLLRALPEWSADGKANDLYYWYHGTLALFRMGGRDFAIWSAALRPAIAEHVARSGAAAGSYEPNGPWGFAGGRVYSTALAALCLQVLDGDSRLSFLR